MYRSRPPARKNHTIPMIPTPFHTPRPKGAANCGATEGSAQSSQSSQIARFARLFLSSLPILLIISYLFISTPASRAAEATDSVRTVTPAPETADTDSLAGAGYTELDDFVIVERKKLLQSDGAKLTYNVTEDPEAGSSNILDILRKVPGVSVDAEDNVKVNGQSSFKILMNGTENPMLKGDLKTVLKSLPAASIKKIEVISEPGAKYEAEGVGGILNIVTDRKTDLSGFLTQLQAWVNAYQVGGYVNGRTKVGKVMLDATVNYNNGNVWPRSMSSSRETEDLTGSANHLETTIRKMKSGWDYVGGNASMSWEPDTLNLFTLSAQYGYNTWGNWGDERREMLAPDLTRRWLIERDRDNDGRYNGLGAEASYQHTFGKDGHNLVLSYMYYFSRMHDESSYSTTLSEGSVADAPYSASRDVTNDNNHVFQIDYANPFSPKHLLECGAKVNLVSTRNDSRSLAGPDAPSAVVMPGSEVNMTQFKDIYAVYASYTGTFDKWNAKAGVRYEHTDMGLRYRTAAHDDFTTRLNDVVPNAALSYNFTNASSLRLAYQMRISRPGLWSLNPFVNDLTPGWLQYGNPDLKSEKGHNVSLGYSNYEGKFSGSAKVTYRQRHQRYSLRPRRRDQFHLRQRRPPSGCCVRSQRRLEHHPRPALVALSLGHLPVSQGELRDAESQEYRLAVLRQHQHHLHDALQGAPQCLRRFLHPLDRPAEPRLQRILLRSGRQPLLPQGRRADRLGLRRKLRPCEPPQQIHADLRERPPHQHHRLQAVECRHEHIVQVRRSQGRRQEDRRQHREGRLRLQRGRR